MEKEPRVEAKSTFNVQRSTLDETGQSGRLAGEGRLDFGVANEGRKRRFEVLDQGPGRMADFQPVRSGWRDRRQFDADVRVGPEIEEADHCANARGKLDACALLDRKARRIIDIDLKYVNYSRSLDAVCELLNAGQGGKEAQAVAMFWAEIGIPARKTVRTNSGIDYSSAPYGEPFDYLHQIERRLADMGNAMREFFKTGDKKRFDTLKTIAVEIQQAYARYKETMAGYEEGLNNLKRIRCR